MGSLRLMWRYSGWVLFIVLLLFVGWFSVTWETKEEEFTSCASGSVQFDGFQEIPSNTRMPAKACWSSDGLITIVNPQAMSQGIVFEPSVPGPLY